MTAPNFTLPDQTGTARSLADYAGKWLLVYFYPEDDTPGCTTEACEFRDGYAALQQAGMQIVGISKDSVDSHWKFADKYRLNFPILADEDGAVAEAYGAGGGLLGRAKRMSFLVNPAGQIVKEYPKVTPKGHAEEILADFRTLNEPKPAA